MKISKLFHWLYAFLMFLPVLALAPSMFYFAFNEHATDYVDVQVIETYEYETNQVNDWQDLQLGNIYKLTFINGDKLSDIFLDEFNCLLPKYNLTIAYDNYLIDDEYYGSPSSEYKTTLYADIPNDTFYLNFFYGDAYTSIGYENAEFSNNSIAYIIFNTFIPRINLIEQFSSSDYLGEKNVEVVRSEQSPINIFYTAVKYVYDMPVFSWAKTSFLALPVTYITGLFGMAQNNVVNYYLSYWLAISIVYLVFDLVMYVPMLVHRWIDKGMLE